MVAQILREGFALAHRRPGVILLDMVWKLIWLALTVGALLLVAYSFISHVQLPISNISMLRQLWNDYGGQLSGMLFVALAVSALVWVVLEAVFRRKLVVAGFSPRSQSAFVLIASNVAKTSILLTAAVVLVVISAQSAYAAVAALAGFVVFAFLLAVIDTLIRSDAVDLLGTNLIEVTGVIGTLLLFEALIGGSLLIALTAGFLSASRPSEALAMIGVTTLVLLFFNFFHSYLLVVRFSAVDIMRRNVGGV